MATVTKSRARKPLAEGQIASSWSNMGDEGERFNFSVRGDEHWFKLSVNEKEAVNIIAYLSGHITWGKQYNIDKRTVSEKLRALADKLDNKQ